MLNIHRLIYRASEVAWDAVTIHLLSVIRLPTAPGTIRIQAAQVLDDILVVVPRNISTTGELQGTLQQRVLDVLAQQVIVESNIPSTTTLTELRRMGLETLHQILQASGHTLVVGWDTIFAMLSSVCKPSSDVVPPSTAPSEPSRNKPPPLGYTNDKAYSFLVKIAFLSLTLVCDSLASLSPAHLRLCISTLGQFGRQADTNIALTAAESLLWGVSDSIQAKRKDKDKEPEYSALWMFLLLEILGLCTDARHEVRIGATQTLFRTLQLYGATLSLETWDECIWKVTFPLLDAITTSMRQSRLSPSFPDAQWNESKILALQSIGGILNDFLASKIMQLHSFSRAWDVFLGHIKDSWLNDDRSVSATAIRCLEKAVKVCAAADESLRPQTLEALEKTWAACDNMGSAVVTEDPSSPSTTKQQDADQSVKPYTQECFVALVDVIRHTKANSKDLEHTEWSFEKLSRLMTILKGNTYCQNRRIFLAHGCI